MYTHTVDVYAGIHYLSVANNTLIDKPAGRCDGPGTSRHAGLDDQLVLRHPINLSRLTQVHVPEICTTDPPP